MFSSNAPTRLSTAGAGSVHVGPRQLGGLCALPLTLAAIALRDPILLIPVPIFAAVGVMLEQKTSREIVAVGDEAFCAALEQNLRSGVHVAARWILGEDDEAVDLLAVPEAAYQCDELVVSERAFAALRRVAPDVMQQAAQLRIVPNGETVPAALAGPIRPAGAVFKRLLDITLAIFCLAVFFPVMLAAAVLIKLDSRGPVLFTQTRLGRNGRRFRLRKLRTMVPNGDDAAHLAYVAALMRGEAEAHDGVFKLVNDPRVTRVGRVLRRFSVDELPQLWNVLMGDMSLVGPRPPMPSEAELYSAMAWQRLRVKPGLTGPWQVGGRAETTFDEMISLDLAYCQSWSPALELKILLQTPKTVFSARGAA
jgi:lipopolysaccharide/colanic/teichoic acid biosynthesis glycosyltransferase